MPRIVIVGGGISGLALAFRLEQLLPNAEVLLLEKRPQLGGTIGTLEQDGFRIETGPNGFLDNNPATWNLCRDLGLESRLIPASESARKNRFVLLDGRLHKLPSGLISFLTTRVLGLRSKFAVLTERFRSPRTESADESIDHFFRRRFNDAIADTLVDAFVTGIHAGDSKLLSVHAAFPRLAELEREYGSVLRGMTKSAKKRRIEAKARGEEPRFGLRTWSFPEGLGLLVGALATALKQAPLTGAEAARVERDATTGQWTVVGKAEERWPADVVALTCAAHAQAEMLADLDAELSGKIAAIPYNRVAVVALGYRKEDVPHSLDGFGYLSPGRQKRDVLGVQWCSSIFTGRAPEGMVLMRAMCGGWHRAEMVDWDDERLLRAVRDELRSVLGIEREPVMQRIVRWRRAIPQYHLGHLERVGWIEKRCERLPGLFVGGNAYRGVAMNDCVDQCGKLASRIGTYLVEHRT